MLIFPITVKKVRLTKTPLNDSKIFREVNALSKLYHRNIVRYYTTWFENSEPSSSTASGDSTDSSAEEGLTSVPDHASERHLPINGQFTFDLDDFDDLSVSRSSFPSIHFAGSDSSDSGGESTSSSEDDEFGGLFKSSKSKSKSGPAALTLGSPPPVPSTPGVPRTLYIQMVRLSMYNLHFNVDHVSVAGVC